MSTDLKSDRINLRVNPDIKEQVELIFDGLGIKTTDAINIFLKKVILCNGFPFDLILPFPNETTIKAMSEPFDSGQKFNTIDEAFKELDRLASDVKGGI